MEDLKLLTMNELLEEIRSRCDCMVFLARIHDQDQLCHKQDSKGWETEILGLMDYYTQGLQAERVADLLKSDDDDDSEDWKS